MIAVYSISVFHVRWWKQLFFRRVDWSTTRINRQIFFWWSSFCEKQKKQIWWQSKWKRSFIVTECLWQFSELTIVFENDDEFDNENDFLHRMFKIDKIFFHFIFNFKFTSDHGWFCSQFEDTDKAQTIDDDDTKNNVQIIAQLAIIRDDSLSWHFSSFFSEEPVISSRSLVKFQRFGTSFTQRRVLVRPSFYGHSRLSKNKPEPSTTSKMMNGQNFLHIKALDVINNQIRKGRFSTLLNEQTRLRNKTYNESLQSLSPKFISCNVELKNKVNKISHENNEQSNNNHSNIMTKDKNIMTKSQIMRKRRLLIQSYSARKRQHPFSVMLSSLFNNVESLCRQNRSAAYSSLALVLNSENVESHVEGMHHDLKSLMSVNERLQIFRTLNYSSMLSL